MRWIRRLVSLALFVAILVGGWLFAKENHELLTIHYLAGDLAGVPQWLALIGVFAAGVVLAAIFFLYQLTKARLVTRRYRRDTRRLESEIHQLRNLPLMGESDVDPAPGLRDEALSTQSGGAGSGV